MVAGFVVAVETSSCRCHTFRGTAGAEADLSMPVAPDAAALALFQGC